MTAAVVSGSPLHRRSGLDQGFSVYEDSFAARKGQRDGADTNAAVRLGDMLLTHGLPKGKAGTGETFTVYERGPRALRELRSPPPSLLKALRSELQALAETTTAHETVKSEVPPEAAEQLRALGYIE